MEKNYIFISYSSKEAESAIKVCDFLEKSGVKCWIAPRDVLPGGNYASQIVAAIRSCTMLVLMASDETNKSGHVSNEISIAFDDKKTIIPFRIKDCAFTDEYLYFLGRKHWINAFEDFNKGLYALFETISPLIEKNQRQENKQIAFNKEIRNEEIEIIKEPIIKEKNNLKEFKSYSRKEIIDLLKGKIQKFPYCLYDELKTEFKYEVFKSYALDMFGVTLSIYNFGKLLEKVDDPIELITETLSNGQGKYIQVNGLPGCAKNMILQLAYFKMLDNFEKNKSNYLPIYLSASFYEKIPYNLNDVKSQMTNIISKELNEFFQYVDANIEVKPVLFIEAIREHNVSTFSPEMIVSSLWKKYGNYNRITAVDFGLIKNRSRLKKVIPIVGDTMGLIYHINSIPITDEKSCLTLIEAVFKMYHYDLNCHEVYNAFKNLKFSTIDIFLVHLITKEILSNYNMDTISLTDMYERLALKELDGDDEKLLTISKELYEYVFNDAHNINTDKYNGALWSLPHKHNTFLEFMIAYYFCYSIQNHSSLTNYSFLSTSTTAMTNHFIKSNFSLNYNLQEQFLEFIEKKYYELDIKQKSNASYWLGKLTYPNLINKAKTILKSEFDKLYPIVKNNYKYERSNFLNQYLFKSISSGLISYDYKNVLEIYLSLIISNEIANAINRGSLIEYFGDNHEVFSHDTFYLDDNPNIGGQVIKILCSNVDLSLNNNEQKNIENELISLLTFIQARINSSVHINKFDINYYVKKTIDIIDMYHKNKYINNMPDKIKYYISAMKDDFEEYLINKKFDAGIILFDKVSLLKEIKRSQLKKYFSEDPDSIAEHMYSAWLIAMIFLPEEIDDETYSKKNIMDMLLIHDIAEYELGDQVSNLNEPLNEIEKEDIVMKKFFVRGTYNNVANLAHFYELWVAYYNGFDINSKIARDINIIQTIYSLIRNNKINNIITNNEMNSWLNEKNKLSTDIGYKLFERIVKHLL